MTADGDPPRAAAGAAGPRGARHRPGGAASDWVTSGRRDLLVGVGGAVGTAARGGWSAALPTAAHAVPVTVLAVNTVGAAALGALLAVTVRGSAPRALFGTGVCGGFTTFSGVVTAAAALVVGAPRGVARGPALLTAGAVLAVAVAAGWTATVAAQRLTRSVVRRWPPARRTPGWAAAAGVVALLGLVGAARMCADRGAAVTTLVVLAGAAGSVARGRADRRLGSPRGTLVVNVVGSALLGLLTGAAAAGRLTPAVLAVAGVGWCGGLTTWSTLMAEAVALPRARARRYVTVSVAVGVGVAAAGLVVGRAAGG